MQCGTLGTQPCDQCDNREQLDELRRERLSHEYCFRQLFPSIVSVSMKSLPYIFGARAPNSALVAMNYSDKLKGADKRCERKLHGQYVVTGQLTS